MGTLIQTKFRFSRPLSNGATLREPRTLGYASWIQQVDLAMHCGRSIIEVKERTFVPIQSRGVNELSRAISRMDVFEFNLI